MSRALQPRVKTREILALMPPDSGLLQRKCACGGDKRMVEGCEKCASRGLSLQRSPLCSNEPLKAPPIVGEVLRSPGQPLDQATRAFFEPRFGHDFSRVRIHADAHAAESALAVGAEAYTVGSNVVFGSRGREVDSSARRELLAHELAHVVQRENVAPGMAPRHISQPHDPEEVYAERASRAVLAGAVRPGGASSRLSTPILSRQVLPQLVHCTAGSDGAPADQVAELKTIVEQAELMATLPASLLRLDAALTRAGNRPMDSTVDQAFDSRFGLPVEAGSGFMNRLTGEVRPTLDIATGEEMELTARRLQMIADQLGSGFIHYLCMSTTRSFGTCNITNCSKNAWACPNVNAIFLCPGFWGGGPESSLLLIHEAAHMIWERVVHGAPGSGGNFRNAECYSTFVADNFGIHREDLDPPCDNP